MTLGSHQQTVGKSQDHVTPKPLIDRLGPCARIYRSWEAEMLTRAKPKAEHAMTVNQETLAAALAVVRAAGYRVSKPRAKPVKDRVGPTFVAKFADGMVTRMSTFTSLENLDWDRGVRLSQAAYQSRWRTRERANHFKRTGKHCPLDPVAPVPPAIISAHFEQDGNVLAQRNGGSAL
jgi:hypothetical protein